MTQYHSNKICLRIITVLVVSIVGSSIAHLKAEETDNQIIKDEGADREVPIQLDSLSDALTIEEKVRIVSKLIERTPGEPDLHLWRGLLFHQAGEFEYAAADLTEAIRLAPEVAEYHYHRAEAYKYLGWYETALEDYDESVRLGTTSIGTFAGRGYLRGLSNNCAGAIEDFTTVLEIDETLAFAYHYRAGCYARLRQNELAFEDFSKIIELHSDRHTAYYHRALVSKRMGLLQSALVDVGRAIRLAPNSATYHGFRAKVHIESRLYSEALRDLEKVLHLKSEDATAYEQLARLLASAPQERIRDGERAISLAQRAISLEPESSRNLETLAAAFAEQGQFLKAVRTQRKAMQTARSGQDSTAAELEIRLHLYRNGLPYRMN